MRLKFTIVSVSAVSALLGLAGIASGAAFQNGSFEIPALTAGNAQGLGNADASVTGWLHNNFGGDFLANSGAFGVSPSGLNGSQWITFVGTGNFGGSIQQTFDTIAGTTYTVGFLLMVQQGTGTQSMKVEALNGLTLLNSLFETNFSTPQDSFTLHPVFTFTATGSSSTLRFTDNLQGSDNSGGANWGLDNVTVAAPNSTPEPGTFGLLALAGGALLSKREHSRRRK
jgi:hypothetical protein